MLKMKLCFLLSSLFSLPVYAQEIQPATDTVRWTTESYSDSLLAISGTSTAAFITYGNTQVKWIPVAGDETSIVFEVQSQTGSWPDGRITSQLLRGSLPRKLTIERNGSAVTIVLRWTDTAGQKRALTYTISEIEKL
jgi:hypothetical protein